MLMIYFGPLGYSRRSLPLLASCLLFCAEPGFKLFLGENVKGPYWKPQIGNPKNIAGI